MELIMHELILKFSVSGVLVIVVWRNFKHNTSGGAKERESEIEKQTERHSALWRLCAVMPTTIAKLSSSSV